MAWRALWSARGQWQVTAESRWQAQVSRSSTSTRVCLDQIRVTVVPVLLGDGVRFFGEFSSAPVKLESAGVCEDSGVIRLLYRIRRSRP